jgi:hypothetical protein
MTDDRTLKVTMPARFRDSPRTMRMAGTTSL